MAHWPKTVRGNLVVSVLALIAVLAVVQIAIALSGPIVWGTLAVVALTTVVIVVLALRQRMTDAEHDLALADAPSFGDVLAHWDRHDDPELPTR